jgi:hypothetical protein
MNYKDDKYSYVGTNYPKIYCHTYWGSGRCHDGPNIEGVFNARNKFIDEYDIKTILKKVAFKKKISHYYCFDNINNDFDHIEYYNTNGGNRIIMVTSPYSEFKGKLWEDMQNIGWTKYDSMYNGAFTYILIINKYKLRQLKAPPEDTIINIF